MKIFALSFTALLVVASLVGCGSDAGPSQTTAGGAGGAGEHSGTGGVSDPAAAAGGLDTGAGNSAGQDCGSFTACSGVLTGSWKLGRECDSAGTLGQIADQLKFCPAATGSVAPVLQNGTLEIDPNTIKVDFDEFLALKELVPGTCLPAGGDCDGLARDMQNDPVTSATCSASADGCSCEVAVRLTQSAEFSYVNNGNSFTWADPSDGSTKTFEYCAAGTVLRLRSDSDIDVFNRQP